MLGVRTREGELAVGARSRTEERLRLSRDVHDVLSHSLGSIGVRAGVAAHVESLGATELRATLRDIESDARSSLGDLRDLLHRERAGDTDAPVPVLSVALADIARDAERTGVTVALGVDPAVDALPVAVRTTAQRIIREAVTNIIRHAAPASAVVTVHLNSDRLQVRVADTGSRAPAGIRAGNGLTGMRERAELVGGTVDWVATATGVTVVADLPCAPSAEER
ncbi:sensor histidine kinase [Microbacterium sp. ZW T5_56]|uniref:sensor histidine kinase n=1 Tax=Microbacterium sp. ZW T5_56 TaxID=3378081 RepID=UPI00385360B7